MPAYVPVNVNVSTPIAPASCICACAVSMAVSLATMFVGSLTSITCTPLSSGDATIAYVLAPIVNVSTDCAFASAVNPLNSSVSESNATMLVGADGLESRSCMDSEIF